MNKCGILFMPAVMLAGQLYAGDVFRKVPGIDDARINRVSISQARPAFMAVASENALYTSSDSGQTFQKVAVLKDEQISHLFLDPSETPVIYMAGTRYGYRIGTETERIFSADADETIHFICKHDGYLYVATSDGLYYTEEGLVSWMSVPGLRGSEVYSVEGFGSSVYLAGSKGVYLFKTDGTLRRLFTARNAAEDGGLSPRLVTVDELTPNRLWLSTNRGLFVSTDRGESWSRFYMTGADNVSINCLAQPPLDYNMLYLCTDSGFFKVNISVGTAEPVTTGLPTSKIRWMDFSGSGQMVLATARGLFQSEPQTAAAETGLAHVMQDEPSIQEVQTAALLYNSVHPDKTENWRKRLRYRALMPKISVDYDKTIGYSVSSSGKYFGVGPYDWGLTVSWDMGNLLWNSYEDDVDNRSRLTTQLRMDILDEVNRLYYERLRIKRELLATGGLGQDAAIKELRLLELTATLDGYTGGIYSREL